MGTTYYTNDALGNVTLVKYPTMASVIFGYDCLSRLTNMMDGIGTTVYAYTSAGQLLSESGPFGNSTVTNGYQNRLRTAMGLQQPTGEWTNGFGYDAIARLSSVTSPAGTFNYQFQPGLQRLVSGLQLPNTSIITNIYDSEARLLATRLVTSGSSTLDSASYGYNTAGRRTTFTNAAGTYVLYSYDKIGQLTVADSSVNTEDRGYYYDAAWNLNRRTNNGAASSFWVDVKNELTNAPAGAATYDANGNQITSANSRYDYTYDDENRLIEWMDNGTIHAVPRLTDFVYDGLGRLRVRLEYVWNSGSSSISLNGAGGSGSWSLSSETHYIYDGKRVIQERDGSNNPTVSYTRGTDLGGTLEGAGGIGGLLARSDGYSSGNWTSHNYYHADGNGNITYLENSSQGLAASYRYDPFGNTISSSGSLAAANLYRFSSKECHVNSGMYYYLYRFYDPNLQRWINRDPVMERGGLNLFGFSANSPISVLDPVGLLTDPEGGRGGRPHEPSSDKPFGWHDLWQFIQNFTPLGGRCKNSSSQPEWALVDGSWRKLNPGESTGAFEDCDGMTCGGGFYAVYALNGECKHPGNDDCPFKNRRWTPSRQGPDAQPPAWDPRHSGRGSQEGNTPQGYIYYN
jgi:RHS repeat-associated protein